MSCHNFPPQKQRDIVLLSTADWDNPYWTNKQHVALKLGEMGHRVLYVESLGLRRPTVSRRDVTRLWRRLKRGLGAPRRVHQSIWVWSPIVLPLHSFTPARVLNRVFFELMLRFWLFRRGLRPDLLWTYSPMAASVLSVRRFRTICYHSVDDVKTQPGVPREAIEQAELSLLRLADVVFVTAPFLLQTHAKHNRNTHFFPNVVDFEHFSRALDPARPVPDDLAAITGPRIGFVGAISSYKLNLELIAEIAQLRPSWSIILIGEVGEGDPNTTLTSFNGQSNIILLGGRSYATLPDYLRGMDVMLLPSRLNEYTRSMFPMKFFEYLAAGRRVVSVALPSLAGFEECVMLRDTAEGFVEAIESALAGGGPSIEHNI